MFSSPGRPQPLQRGHGPGTHRLRPARWHHPPGAPPAPDSHAAPAGAALERLLLLPGHCQTLPEDAGEQCGQTQATVDDQREPEIGEELFCFVVEL